MIDSGSLATFIRLSLAKRLNLLIFSKNKTVPLADDNHVAKVVGEVIVDLEVNGVKHVNTVVEIIPDLCTDVIIGRDILGEHKRVVLNFNGPREDLVIGAMPTSEDGSPEINEPSQPNSSTSPIQPPRASNSSNSVIPDNFGAINIPPPPLFTHLSSNVKPVATKSRRQSPVDLAFMREEVARLSRAGIIRPSVSPWRAQAFVTKEDDNHKKRMVIDYSDTINLYTDLDAYPMPNVLKMVQEISQYKYFATFDLKSAYHQIPIRDEDSKYTAFEVDGQLWEFTRIPFGVTNGVSAFQR